MVIEHLGDVCMADCYNLLLLLLGCLHQQRMMETEVSAVTMLIPQIWWLFQISPEQISYMHNFFLLSVKLFFLSKETTAKSNSML